VRNTGFNLSFALTKAHEFYARWFLVTASTCSEKCISSISEVKLPTRQNIRRIFEWNKPSWKIHCTTSVFSYSWGSGRFLPTLPLLVLSIPRDPLANIADVVPQPIFGPSLSIDGQTAQWNGQRTGVSIQVGVACRVIFDANVGDRITSHLDICNDGTTAIYFSWKVSYDLVRFFFCDESAVVDLNVHSRRLDTLWSSISGIFYTNSILCPTENTSAQCAGYKARRPDTKVLLWHQERGDSARGYFEVPIRI